MKSVQNLNNVYSKYVTLGVIKKVYLWSFSVMLSLGSITQNCLSLKIFHNSDAKSVQSEAQDSEERHRVAFNYRDCCYPRDGDHMSSISQDKRETKK